MEQALENYDICTEMLQSSTGTQGKAGTECSIVIRLPNLHVDSVVSLEEVRIHVQVYVPCSIPHTPSLPVSHVTYELVLL